MRYPEYDACRKALLQVKYECCTWDFSHIAGQIIILCMQYIHNTVIWTSQSERLGYGLSLIRNVSKENIISIWSFRNCFLFNSINIPMNLRPLLVKINIIIMKFPIILLYSILFNNCPHEFSSFTNLGFHEQINASLPRSFFFVSSCSGTFILVRGPRSTVKWLRFFT